MEQEKHAIELTVEEISMIMDGLNRAQICYFELCLPKPTHSYGALWSRFYELKYNDK